MPPSRKKSKKQLKAANRKSTHRTPRATNSKEPRVRTLFFGTSEFAVPSFRAVAQATDLAGVVTQPDRPAGRGHKLTPTPVKKAALEYGVRIYEPASMASFVQEHAGESYDLFALASYGKILPAAVLEMPSFGALNVHPSLLPKYRGATPIQTALCNGDTQTGVTIMMMDAGMDTGPIVLQERVAIMPLENYGALHDRLAQHGADMLAMAIERAKNKNLRSRPQTGDPSVTKTIKKEDLRIDWSSRADTIVNMIRAYSPRPAARAELCGIPAKIFAAQRVAWPMSQEPARPGHIALSAGLQMMTVKCGDDAVAILELTSPGKPRESGYEFYLREIRE
ncbi:MAG: methionyl-tRNA formyltransferase [Candidatus Baltobacteraceae bacterium]